MGGASIGRAVPWRRAASERTGRDPDFILIAFPILRARRLHRHGDMRDNLCLVISARRNYAGYAPYTSSFVFANHLRGRRYVPTIRTFIFNRLPMAIIIIITIMMIIKRQ